MTSPKKPQDRKSAPETNDSSSRKEAPDSNLEKKPLPMHMEKPAVPHMDVLDLPKGALVAYRRSGGVKFRTQSIVVYLDGRIIYVDPVTAKPTQPQLPPPLSKAQIDALRKMLDQSNFFGIRVGGGNQPPDSFAHEILARIENRSNFVEVFDGGIPDALKPLVDKLSAWLPKER